MRIGAIFSKIITKYTTKQNNLIIIIYKIAGEKSK